MLSPMLLVPGTVRWLHLLASFLRTREISVHLQVRFTIQPVAREFCISSLEPAEDLYRRRCLVQALARGLATMEATVHAHSLAFRVGVHNRYRANYSAAWVSHLVIRMVEGREVCVLRVCLCHCGHDVVWGSRLLQRHTSKTSPTHM